MSLEIIITVKIGINVGFLTMTNDMILNLKFRESEIFKNDEFTCISIYDIVGTTALFVRQLAVIVASQWDSICEEDAYKLLNCGEKLSIFVTKYTDGVNTVNLSVKPDADLINLGEVSNDYDEKTLADSVINYVTAYKK